ncbi:MAG: hypothetical protein K0S28_552, partial [Paucimonas sp.]|nr:hypothetical protein [Paucimonas sp.]
MYLTRRLALLGAALAAAFPAVHAAGAEAVDQIATLADIVVVSGSKEGTLLRDTPAAISKIGRETIEQKKPTFVGQLLNEAPGVYVTDLGNEQHSMSIRQPLSYNAVYLYMEDGLPIRPVGLFNHNSLYEINLTGVGDIEVLKGPASSLYGSNAVGGAVNFFTRAPSPKPEATIGVQLTDQGYRRIDYGASGAFGNHGLRIAGYKAQRRGGWQSYNDADKDGVTLRYDLGVSDTTLLKTVLSYNRLLTDMPGTLNKSDYDNRPGFSYQTFTWRKVEATRLSSALEGNWNSGGMTTITAYARDNTTNQLPSYLIFNTGAFTALGRTTSQHFTSLGVDARHRQDFSDGTFRLIAGITGENTPMEASEMNLSVVRDPASGIYTA